MRTTTGILPLLLASLALAACEDDATAPDGFATDELTAALTVTPGHFHSYETEGTFAVSVTDPDGLPVTDFDIVRLERRAAGAAGWTALELAREGDLYVGRHTFETSGSYELRVTGMRASDDELVVLYTAPAALEVVRAHGEVGGRRVEIENVPGHIHAGDEAAVTFWVTELEGAHAPVTGLAPTVWVEVGGVRTSDPAVEAEPGVYGATHRFTTVGPATVGLRFEGTDGQEHEWSVEIEVHEPH